MRTLLGILIGGVLGGLSGDFMGALGGAIIGGTIGWFWGRAGASPEPGTGVPEEADRVTVLERKAQYLYDQLQQALKRIERLEAGAGVRPQPGQTAAVAQADADDALAAGSVAKEEPEALPGTAPALPPASSVTARAATQAAHVTGSEDMPRAEEAADASARMATPVTVATPAAEPGGSARQDTEPSVFDQALRAARDWFMGGNTVVRVGIVILFFGLAFLLKYAYEHSTVPPEMRVLAVALGGIALLGLGWRLRARRAGYAQALQGGGVGVLYLAIFAAFRLYGLLPAGVAFGLMICIAGLSAVLAVMQNAQALALLGVSGGFLAPILASTGEGSHVALFSYYALLNAGLLAIAWFKAWRVLNWAGFLFTFGIGLLWGVRYYHPDFYGSTQPFLILFFAMYLLMSVLFALRQAPRLKHYLDGTLIFGLPIVAFGMQTRLVSQHEYGAAVSALALAFTYLVLARSIHARHRDDLKALVEVFLALGVVFATLAIPLALDGRWTSAAWALEGAALVWLGLRQARLSARLFGLLLQVGAAVAFLSRFDVAPVVTPVANSFFLGALFLSVAGLFSNYMLDAGRATLRSWERPAVAVLFWWGVLWWLVAGLTEIDRQVSEALRLHAALLFVTVSCLVFGALRKRLDWSWARFPVMGLTPLATLVLAAEVEHPVAHPLANLGWIAWPVWLAAHLRLLRRHEEAFVRWAGGLHALGLWLLAALGAWESSWWFDQWLGGGSVWGLIAWAVVPGALAWALVAAQGTGRWPLATHPRAYLLVGAGVLVAFLGLWVLYGTATHDGNPTPLPYLPVLSPLDLVQLGVLLVAVHWYRGCGRTALIDAPAHGRLFHVTLGIVAFVCANGILLRTLHHWAGVPFDLEAMMQSMLVQAAFSVFWAVLALGAMVIASRLGRRALWMTGAGLMALVVAKLFLVDLSAIGGVERIVSFIGVGVLMLVVGYFSPVPPKRPQEAA